MGDKRRAPEWGFRRYKFVRSPQSLNHPIAG